MDGLYTPLAIVGALALLSRVYVIRQRNPDAMAFGLTVGGVVIMALILAILNDTGRIVHSEHFGLLMIQGAWGRVVLGAFAFGVSVAIGAVLTLAVPKARRSNAGPLLIFIGMIVGLAALLGVVQVSVAENPSANALSAYEVAAVSAYDLWWPPLVIWALLGTLAVIATYSSRALELPPLPSVWLLGAIAAGLTALLALFQPHVQTPAVVLRFAEAGVWYAAGVVFTTIALWLAVWMLPELLSSVADAIPRALLAARRWAIGAGKWVFSKLRITRANLQPGAAPSENPDTENAQADEMSKHRIRRRAIAATVVAIFYLILAIAGNGLGTTGRFAVIAAGLVVAIVVALIDLASWLGTEGVKSMRSTTMRERIAFWALVVGIYAGTDLGWFGRLPMGLSIVILTIAGSVITAAISQPDPQTPMRSPTVLVRSSAQLTTTAVPGVWNRVKQGAMWVVTSIRSILKVESIPALVVKTLIGGFVLVALNEIPDAGKIVLRPFQSHSAPKIEDLGDAVADRVYYKLRRLYDEVAIESVIPETMSRGATNESANMSGASALNAPLGKDQSVEFNGVKIPLDVVLRPVQSTLRASLGTRSVTGVVNADTNWIKVAVSVDHGHTWSDSAKIRPPAVDSMAERIAFAILSDAKDALIPGMTRSWPAYLAFRDGIRAWKHFLTTRTETPETYTELTYAIQQFRDALRLDPSFAIAYYRLGRALAAYGERSGATEAYRLSLATGTFLPTAANALAASDGHSSRDQWYRILNGDGNPSPVDQAAAYFGLCENLSEPRREADSVVNINAALLGYFYCKRSQTVFRRLPPRLATHAGARDVESHVAYQLGEVFRSFHSVDSLQLSGWTCAPDIRVLPVVDDRYAAAAKEYFAEARLLGNADAACRIALVSSAAGDPGPLATLMTQASARAAVGDYYTAVAMISAARDDFPAADDAFRLANSEYREAIRRGAADFHTLNNYAYNIWRWGQAMPAPRGPSWRDLDSAESAARQLRGLVIDSTNDRGLTARSTLAEILLATGRAHEAHTILEEMLPRLPNHWFSNETLQDAARAAVCAAKADGRGATPASAKHYETLLTLASSHLDSLRNRRDEFRGRDQNVVDEELTLEGIQTRCHAPRPVADLQFVLSQRAAEPDPGESVCHWTGIRVRAADASGTGDRVLVRDGMTTYRADIGAVVWLSAHQMNSHGYVTVQLLDSSGRTISAPVPVDTYADCKTAVVALTFVKKPPTQTTAVQAGTARK